MKNVVELNEGILTKQAIHEILYRGLYTDCSSDNTPNHFIPSSGFVVTLTENPIRVNTSSKKLYPPICSFVSISDIFVPMGKDWDIKEDKLYIFLAVFFLSSSPVSPVISRKNLFKLCVRSFSFVSYIISIERLISKSPVIFKNRQSFLISYFVSIDMSSMIFLPITISNLLQVLKLP